MHVFCDCEFGRAVWFANPLRTDFLPWFVPFRFNSVLAGYLAL
jgi:hypothetical protein